LMHDGLSFTKEDAIARHQGQATPTSQAFGELLPAQKQQVLDFLDSL